MKATLYVVIVFILTACVDPSRDPLTAIRKTDDMQHLLAVINTPFIAYPTPDHYSICHGHTCAKFFRISLTASQWQDINILFNPAALNAEDERLQIKKAIALFEVFSGKQAGTDKDKAKNDVSEGLTGQLDCIDEATNTTVYLRLIANDGLLLFHQQGSRTSRGGLIAPHNTATIIQVDNHQRYAVDSWFYANGYAPVIIPLSQWKNGWQPGTN